MPQYLVERVMPGVTLACVEAIRQAAGEACRASSVEGKPIRYVRSVFTPGESRCRCLFEAASSDLVREVNEAAQVPYSRIIMALDLEPL
jgi:Protein of unknown function (DUF4242)